MPEGDEEVPYNFTIKADLPPEVHGVCYTKNHHFLELTDALGRKIKLNATGLVQYICRSCQFMCLTPSNNGELFCPGCKQSLMDPQWTRVQLSFVPEDPSDFRGGFPSIDAPEPLGDDDDTNPEGSGS